jgi:EAL domain-containing protein (putative c-di-GMP-specific phosphodiesterase class I)
VLVTTMLRLAADLGLDVVAEGVETELQAEILRGHGCHLAQGFHFSRPQPPADLRRIWLESLGLPALAEQGR